MLDSLFWWTGFTLWACFAVALIVVLAALLWHVVCTTIFTRRVWRDAARCYRESGDPLDRPKVRRIPVAWWSYFCNPPTRMHRRGSVICWPGVEP